MKINFINEDHTKYASEKLNEFYKKGLIPAEKKPYLSHHRKSYGPYLGVEGSKEHGHIQDAASQIATLGLGFNPTPFFGITHFYEAWTNDTNTEDAKDLLKAFKGFLKKHTANRNMDICFTNSGAEANETALGMAFSQRKNKKAKKVMAFEGSFHGRFLISLFSTWNKAKREPYQLKGYETTFMPYPALEHSNFEITPDQNWLEFWSNPYCEDFSKKAATFSGKDQELNLELDCLLKVRQELEKNEHFAIIIEPMQCEGGDRYSSSRFHNALTLLAKSYGVAIIYDEVQTGFGLGRDIFWHRTFNLKDHMGNTIYPDYVTCAKKAQTGLVIGDKKLPWNNEEFQFASIIRGFYHGLIIDQKRETIIELEKTVSKKLNDLVEKYDQLSLPRCYGMAFAFEIDNEDDIPKFISNRFKVGQLFYQAGAKTLRFRLNTSYKTEDINYLFKMIDALCDHIYNGVELPTPEVLDKKNIEIDWEYMWHEKLISSRLSLPGETDKEDALNYCSKFFKSNFDLKFISINKENFKDYKNAIIDLETEVYEPTRQTEIEKFEEVVNTNPNIAIALIGENGELVGISFAGKMSSFPKERGLRRCKYFNDPQTVYMLDTTIKPTHQGLSLGKYLKYSLELIGTRMGLNYIYGRNRDKLAGAMLSVNTSLGLVPELYLEEDYPDNEEYRDVFIYRSPLKWTTSQRKKILSSQRAPFLEGKLTKEFIHANIDKMINKVCLSNFVSFSFLENVDKVASTAPESLRHVYTASGQSEAVDKIMKSIYLKNKEKNPERKQKNFISFRGHRFGQGSFLSRSLSNEVDAYFPTTFFDHPTEENSTSLLRQINEYLTNGENIALFIEPSPQSLDTDVPLHFLKELKTLCKKYETPLVYNETTNAPFYQKDSEKWFSSNDDLMPDAFFAYLGGQVSLCFISEEYFVEKPLMMISTWDGDAFSLAQFCETQKDPKSLVLSNIDNKLLKMGKTIASSMTANKLFPKRTLSIAERVLVEGNGPFYPSIEQLNR